MQYKIITQMINKVQFVYLTMLTNQNALCGAFQ